jgi:hypothetical protein
MKKWGVIIALIALLIPLLGCGPSTSSHEGMVNYNGEWVTREEYLSIKSGDQPAPDVTVPPPQSAPSPSRPAVDLDYAGGGDDVIAAFNLPEGTFIFDMTCDGDGHFSVWLIKQGVGEIELLANDVGAYSGKASVTIQQDSVFGQTPGNYLLDISADGHWSVKVYE